MFFPVMIDLDKINILIIGGGNIAYRKYSNKSQYTDNIKVISPFFCENFIKENNKRLSLLWKKFEYKDLNNIDMVFIATDNKILNKEISDYCIKNRILVNSVDNHKNSSFINMGFFEFKDKNNKDDIVVGVSCNGKNPSLVKIIKNELKDYFSSRRG